jgi:hypothetical protein
MRLSLVPMKLDYIPNINAYGDCVVRLFDFDKSEALKFQSAINSTIIQKKKSLDLSQLDYIEHSNCMVLLMLGEEDEGMVTLDDYHFVCKLTMETYEKMVLLIAPFCLKDRSSHQMLYDVDSLTDFLFSPAGTSTIADESEA